VLANIRADPLEIYDAPNWAAAEAAIDIYADNNGAKFEEAVASLRRQVPRASRD
jgi:hypothetical protein